MDNLIKSNDSDLLQKISKDRDRTNLLKKYEQQLLAYLVQRIPKWMNSDMLTAIGFIGSIITTGSFILARFFPREWLLLGILGFIVNYYGDSLDGRLAYYRNRPRKWYGFSLDYLVDWFSNIFIGWGFIVYVHGPGEIVGFIFVVLYGWAMMMALLHYKLTDKYRIDSGIFGPTEVRIILCLAFILEVIVPNTIVYSAIFACIILLILNTKDFLILIKLADKRDKEEKAQKNNI